MDLLGPGDRVAGARDLDRVAGQPLRLGEDAVEHLQLGERGEDRGPFRARLARDELDRPSRREHRPGRVPGSAPDMGQPLVEQAERDAIAPGVEAADRRFEVGRRARHLADREGRLRGTDLEVDPVRRVRRLPPGGRRSAAGPRAARAPARARRARRRRRGDAPANAAASMAAIRARCGSWPTSQCQATADGGPPRLCRQGRVIAGPGDRQQVARHGTSDRCVAEGDDVVASRPGNRWRAPRCGRPTGRRRARRRRRAARSRSVARTGRCRPRTRRRRRPADPLRAAGRQATAGAGPGGTPRERIASRAMTSSSKEPVSDALGSSRRAASSSSATSGRPPDRSATRRSRLADARSPSMPSIRAASSSRSSGGSVRRSGSRGPATIDPRSAVHGSSRPTTSG